MNKPLIFLDIDGVLNSHAWWDRRAPAQSDQSLEDYYLRALDPDACALLQGLCEDTGAEIVVMSTWRILHPVEEIRHLLGKRGVTTPILGVTPDLRHHEKDFQEPWSSFGRGLEVQWWLRERLGDEGAANTRLVLVDDDSDFGVLKPKRVHTSFSTGLTTQHVEEMKAHLSQTLRESDAAGGPGEVTWKYDDRVLEPYWCKASLRS